MKISSFKANKNKVYAALEHHGFLLEFGRPRDQEGRWNYLKDNPSFELLKNRTNTEYLEKKANAYLRVIDFKVSYGMEDYCEND